MSMHEGIATQKTQDMPFANSEEPADNKIQQSPNRVVACDTCCHAEAMIGNDGQSWSEMSCGFEAQKEQER